MTKEEKAKAYDKALEMAKNVMETDLHESGVWAITKIFPELKESEDERIRKAILGLTYLDGIEPILTKCSVTAQDIRKYLEKQKAAETPQWMIDFLNDIRTASINKEGYDDYDGRREYEGKILAIIGWLEGNFIQQKEQKPVEFFDEYKIIKKHITEDMLSSEVNKRLTECGWYVTDEKPAEWGEEDEKMLLSIINAFRNGALSTIGQEQWLKSLPERFNLQPQTKQEQKPLEYLPKEKVYHIMRELSKLSLSDIIPIESEEYEKIDEITSDVRDLLDYPIEKNQEVDLENEAVAFCFDNGINVTPYQATRIAHYFYELGRKGNKELKKEFEKE